MPFPQPFLDALVERNPIEEVVGQYVTLTRKGSNLFGLCPFHSEKTGSFSVAPEKGIYYCFGCHKGGGVINFIMEIESLSYPDAVRFLAKRAGLEVPEDEEYRAQYKRTERLYALCKDAARWFRKQLLADAGHEARDYIVKRGLFAQTVNRFGLGFSPNEWSALMDAMQKQGYTQKELLDGAAAVVVDANLPRESIAYLVEHCAAPLFVDPVSTVKAEKLQGLLSHVHTLKPNRIEAELLSGVKITDDATLYQAAQALLDQGVQRVFLSLGGDGVFAAQQGETHLEPICKAEMRNATGAGDAMMASLVWSFLAGRNLAESCAAGTAAAAIAVESEETINPAMSAEAVLARAAK
ncbi:hypothetical protein EGR95_04305 [bacterium]|nr:hypothetical protein [bacterium]